MRTLTLAFILMAAALLNAGCAAGFRAGGDRAGVGAGVAVTPPPPTYIPPDPAP